MKKLALALVCLVSVAFLASCDPTIQNPQPTITVLNEEGYLQNGAVIDLDQEYDYGFVMASNAETGKLLKKLSISIDGRVSDFDLNCMDTTFRGLITYSYERDSIVGNGIIQATVTDEAGEMATASIEFSINDPAKPLTTKAFEWYRLGSGANQIQTGLEEFGLYWQENAKVTHAQIVPKDGVKMFFFQPTDWEETTTDVEKARLKNKALENYTAQTVYNNVSTTAGGTYNDVIGTITTDGEFHLINVKKCVIGQFQPQGYPITISGESK